MKRTGAKWPAVFAALAVVAGLSWFVYHSQQATITMRELNAHLDADGLRLGMTEDEVTKLFGEGRHIQGFGDYGREYRNLELLVGFSRDPGSGLYGKVAQLSFSNSRYSIFGVRVGVGLEEARSRIASVGFRRSADDPDLFRSGEWVIALRGRDKVESVLIRLADRDTRDKSN
jgi:hypothetical protein